jgi:hypothetical protein
VSYRAPRRGAPRHYAIGGRKSTRDEVEQLALPSKEDLARVGRYHRIEVAFPLMFGLGHLSAVAGGVTSLATRNPLYLLISAAGLATGITGIVLEAGNRDPLPAAMDAFNVRALRDGVCDERPFPAKPRAEASPSGSPLPSPAAPALPTLPAPGWSP